MSIYLFLHIPFLGSLLKRSSAGDDALQSASEAGDGLGAVEYEGRKGGGVRVYYGYSQDHVHACIYVYEKKKKAGDEEKERSGPDRTRSVSNAPSNIMMTVIAALINAALCTSRQPCHATRGEFESTTFPYV